MLFGSDPVAPVQKGERNVKTRFVSETIYYESQPVGLAEVIDASEASLGGQSGKNRCKQGQVGWFLILCVFQGHVPGGNWVTVGFNPLVRSFGGSEGKLRTYDIGYLDVNQ